MASCWTKDRLVTEAESGSEGDRGTSEARGGRGRCIPKLARERKPPPPRSGRAGAERRRRRRSPRPPDCGASSSERIAELGARFLPPALECNRASLDATEKSCGTPAERNARPGFSRREAADARKRREGGLISDLCESPLATTSRTRSKARWKARAGVPADRAEVPVNGWAARSAQKARRRTRWSGAAGSAKKNWIPRGSPRLSSPLLIRRHHGKVTESAEEAIV